MSREQHQQRMTKVTQYIESHLDSEADVQTLANIACYSQFHFHRLFRLYVGEGIYSYRKRLLLERSVKHLLYSTDSIIDIAFKCGYENQASYNKAFKAQFAYTPSQVRQQQRVVDLKPQSSAIGSPVVKVEIKTIDAIRVIAAREVGAYTDAAPKAWGRLMQFTYSNRLMKKEVRSFGISHDDPSVSAADTIRYDACVDLDVDISGAEDLHKTTIAGGRYAVFLHKGSYENFAATYGYIFNEWLPDSGEKLRDEPCFDIYLNRDPRRTKPENLRTEIYVPLVG